MASKCRVISSHLSCQSCDCLPGAGRVVIKTIGTGDD